MNTPQRILLSALVSVSTCLNGELITEGSLTASGKVEHFEAGSSFYESVIQIAEGKSLPVTLDVTSKGNGELNIGGLKLHVIDGHHDGAYYEKDMLDIALSDINDDGFRDMIISGIVCYTGEKYETVLEREAVAFIYQFNPKTSTFEKAYTKASFSLEEGSSFGHIYERYRNVD